MTINYTTEPIQPQRTYPWVGKHTREGYYTIVLFVGPNEGFCLDSTDQTNLDDRYSEDWAENEFIPCSITLSSL
jgi:hypothetical protein